MDSSKKLYIALAVLAVLGGGLFLQNRNAKEEARAYSYEAKVAELPKIEVSAESKAAIDRVELTVPQEKPSADTADAGAEAAKPTSERYVLIKKGEEEWVLESHGGHKANAGNVQSLLDNLEKLKIVEPISTGTDSYERWGVTDEKAIHATFKKGDETVLDVYFGEDGSRGQMVRLADKEGVYAAKGYSKYLYNRDLKGWREKAIFKFDDAQAESAVVKNETGEYRFEKQDGKWIGTFTPAGSSAAKSIERFKASKVDDMLRAYKTLNAADFGDEKKPTEVGLDEPIATVAIKLQGEGGSYELLVGDNAEGKNRWVKKANEDQIYSISSWAGDWATATVAKFQEEEPSKSDTTTKD